MLTAPHSGLPSNYASLCLSDDEGNGFEIVVHSDPGHYDQWLIEQRPFSPIARLLRLVLDGAGIFIDVGANIGTIAVPLAQRVGQVLAIEMLPENCLRLVLAQKLNGLRNITVFQGAATNEECIVNYVGNEAYAAVSTGTANNQAAGYRLDLIFSSVFGEDMEAVDGEIAIKIDVEGHEAQVLEGAMQLIESVRPIFVYESLLGLASENSRKAALFLRKNRYNLYQISEHAISFEESGAQQESFLADYIAIPEEKVEIVLQQVAKGFEVRPLTNQERIFPIHLASLSTDNPEHNEHAIATIEKWQASAPDLAADAGHVTEHLLTHSVPETAAAAQRRLRRPS